MAVADDAGSMNYPDRSALIADMCGLWKAARRAPPEEAPGSCLDGDGWERLYRLAERLVRHLNFEYLEQRKLRNVLVGAVRQYKDPPDGKRPNGRQFAAEILDGLAREPMRRTLYLGVQHLKLPHAVTVGEVRFLLPSHDEELAQAFARLGDAAPELVCEVEAVGGTDELLRDRARKTVEGALALVRQQMLFGSMNKIYLDQVMFGLDGKYSWREGSDIAGAGWWREPQPIPMDFTADSDRAAAWLVKLDGLSADYSAVPPGLRERVDTCVAWLDVAARSDRWQIIVPAVFSAIEAILVPEKSGLKAAPVTVRSVAVHVAVGAGFFDPGKTVTGYELRSDLVHGTPTSDVLDRDATEFAEFTRSWAFNVLRDYLKLAKTIGAGTVNDIVANLR